MDLERIKSEIEAAVPGCELRMIANGSPCAEHSLLIDKEHARATAYFLRDHPDYKLDYCSNATGLDWLDAETTRKVKPRKLVDGVEQEVEEAQKTAIAGYLEAVYHLYSMARKHGPLILRMRTTNRTDATHLPSLTPVWRSVELQEREIFDLFGIVFDGHPDLRRLLMWDGFADHPMRKDYLEPDDYEYEPTAHDDVLAKAQRHVGHLS